jgi:hypothetical protein
MTHLTDDDLGDLLRATFADHEHLADPDLAVALASSPARRPRRGRVLLAAAAAVVVVAAGTTYLVSRGSGAGPSAGPTSSPTPAAPSGQPALPPLQTDAGNRLRAMALTELTLARVPSYPGSRTTSALPELSALYLADGPTDHTVVRDRWSVAPATLDARAVAQWYADHPARGYVSDGGVGSASGSDTPTVYFAAFQPRGPHPSTAADVLVETTTTSGGVGTRVTTQSVWAPARPLASFVQDVSSIDVQSTHEHHGRHHHTLQRTSTVSDPARVLGAARVFNALPGQAPYVHSCPAMTDSWTDRIVFHLSTGALTVVSQSSACGVGMSVRRDGRRVAPDLGNAQALLRALGVTHSR